MQPLKKQTVELLGFVGDAMESLKIADKSHELAAIDEQLADSNAWANVERAQMLSKQSAALRLQVEPWLILRAQVADLEELLELGDESMCVEISGQIGALQSEYDRLRKDLLFQGEFDDHNAIL